MPYEIVQAVPAHVPFLPGIEDAAGELFSLDDLPEPARSTGVATEQFRHAVAAGCLWVALEAGGDVPVGFVMAGAVDGGWHLRELDVHPDHARRGIGSRLLDQALAAAAARGFQVATLTTFEHVPWNGPFYARRGFRTLQADQLGSGIARLLERERALGMRRRIAMAKVLHQAASTDPFLLAT